MTRFCNKLKAKNKELAVVNASNASHDANHKWSLLSFLKKPVLAIALFSLCTTSYADLIIDKIITLQQEYLNEPINEVDEAIFAKDQFQYSRLDYLLKNYENKLNELFQQDKLFANFFKKYENGNNLLHIASIIGDGIIFNKLQQLADHKTLVELANAPNDFGLYPIDYCNPFNRKMFREILLLSNNLLTLNDLLKKYAKSIINSLIEFDINYATDAPLRLRFGEEYKGPNALTDKDFYEFMSRIAIDNNSNNADILLSAETVIYGAACLKLRPDLIPYNIWKYILIDDATELDKEIKIRYNFDFQQIFCEYSLVDIAAECGSLKCFNYFIAKKCPITKNSILCATSGGNLSIITALRQLGCKLDNEMMSEAIRTHQHEIVKWLLLQVEINSMTANKIVDATKALNFPNVKFFVQVLTKFVNYASADSGNTALHLASKIGHIAIVDFLLKNGADPDLCNIDGLSALNFASEYGKVDIIQLLLKNAKNQYLIARCPHFAASNNHVAALKLFEQSGLDMNFYDQNLQYPINLAAKNGHLEATKLLYDYYKKDKKITFLPSLTPLHLAAEFNQIQIAQFLLENNEDVDNAQNRENLTPLHIAAKNNNIEMVNLLLKYKANPNIHEYPSGKTPLHYSISHPNVYILEKLINAGAKIDAEDIFGNTPLHYANTINNKQAISTLIKHNANPIYINRIGEKAI